MNSCSVPGPNGDSHPIEKADPFLIPCAMPARAITRIPAISMVVTNFWNFAVVRMPAKPMIAIVTNHAARTAVTPRALWAISGLKRASVAAAAGSDPATMYTRLATSGDQPAKNPRYGFKLRPTHAYAAPASERHAFK